MILLIFVPLQAHTQENPYTKEVKGFLNYCINQSEIGSLYSCNCMAAQFLNKRTELGPGPTSPEIIQMLDPYLCPTEAALETKSDLDEIPQSILEDVKDFENNCKGDVRLYTTFDCECLAGQYLDAKLDAGPDVARSSLMLQIDHTCPNIEEAAGEAYSECYAEASLMPNEGSIDKFCACYGRTYAKLRQELKTALTANMRITLKARAMGMCS